MYRSQLYLYFKFLDLHLYSNTLPINIKKSSLDIEVFQHFEQHLQEYRNMCVTINYYAIREKGEGGIPTEELNKRKLLSSSNSLDMF